LVTNYHSLGKEKLRIGQVNIIKVIVIINSILFVIFYTILNTFIFSAIINFERKILNHIRIEDNGKNNIYWANIFLLKNYS